MGIIPDEPDSPPADSESESERDSDHRARASWNRAAAGRPRTGRPGRPRGQHDHDHRTIIRVLARAVGGGPATDKSARLEDPAGPEECRRRGGVHLKRYDVHIPFMYLSYINAH